jgi:hypothetical protein
VLHHRLADLPPDGQERVQRGHRLLEDHRNVVAADRLHLHFAEIEQIAAIEMDGAADNTSRRARDQPQDGKRRDAFPAAALADDPKRLTTLDVVRHTVNRPHGPGRREEMRLQIVDVEDRPGLHRAGHDGRLFRRSCFIQG